MSVPFFEQVVGIAEEYYYDVAAEGYLNTTKLTMPETKRKRSTAGRGTRKFLKGYTMQYKRPSNAYSGSYDRVHKEKKFFDVTKSFTPVLITGNIIDTLVEIPQGTAARQRVGRKLNVTDIFQNIIVVLPNGVAPGTATSNQIRIILYCDKQTNGATAVVTDILAASDFQSFYNMASIQRFNILYDKTATITATSNGQASSTSNEAQQFYKKAHTNLNTTIEYDASASTGAISTIRSNNYGMLLISKFATVNVTVVTRVRFTD